MATITMNYFSKSLMRVVQIKAILPIDQIDYMQREYGDIKPFRSLYLLHGIMGNSKDWLENTRILSYIKRQNIAVFMPNGENSMYVDQEKNGVFYGEFIGKELLEITRATFHLSNERKDTFLAGLSMGGFGALRNGLAYEALYSVIGSFSGAIPTKLALETRQFPSNVFGLDFRDIANANPELFDLYALVEENLNDLPNIYLSCGTEDFLLENNREFVQYLVEKNVLHTYHESSGEHDWDFWDKAIKDFVAHITR